MKTNSNYTIQGFGLLQVMAFMVLVSIVGLVVFNYIQSKNHLIYHFKKKAHIDQLAAEVITFLGDKGNCAATFSTIGPSVGNVITNVRDATGTQHTKFIPTKHLGNNIEFTRLEMIDPTNYSSEYGAAPLITNAPVTAAGAKGSIYIDIIFANRDEVGTFIYHQAHLFYTLNVGQTIAECQLLAMNDDFWQQTTGANQNRGLDGFLEIKDDESILEYTGQLHSPAYVPIIGDAYGQALQPIDWSKGNFQVLPQQGVPTNPMRLYMSNLQPGGTYILRVELSTGDWIFDPATAINVDTLHPTVEVFMDDGDLEAPGGLMTFFVSEDPDDPSILQIYVDVVNIPPP